MFPERPSNIKKAMIEGNTDYLSAAGKKGAIARHEKFEQERILQDIRDEEMRLAHLKCTMSANKHIIDPDGNDLDFNPTNTDNI